MLELGDAPAQLAGYSVRHLLHVDPFRFNKSNTFEQGRVFLGQAGHALLQGARFRVAPDDFLLQGGEPGTRFLQGFAIGFTRLRFPAKQKHLLLHTVHARAQCLVRFRHLPVPRRQGGFQPGE